MNNGTLRLNQASLTLHTLFFLLPSFFKTVKAAANRRDYGVIRTLGILVAFLHKLSENIGHNELPSSQPTPALLAIGLWKGFSDPVVEICTQPVRSPHLK